MASPSATIDSDATISDMSSSDVPVDEIPPPVIDVEEEEVAMKRRKIEVEVPQWLIDLAGNQVQDWRAFVQKRVNGHIDRTYVHKKYRNQFRSKREVKRFINSGEVTKGTFNGRKLQKKMIAGMDAQDAGTSKSTRRRASANDARPKRSLSQSRSTADDEEKPPGFF